MMGISLKKSRIKAGLAALLCVGLFCPLFGQKVSAEEGLQIGIDQYEVDDAGDLIIYVNQNKEDGFQPATSQSSMMIGKNTVAIKEIRSFQETGEAVSYLCLVDISGSMTKEGIAQTQSILKQLTEEKQDSDNICITTMGNDVMSSAFLTQKDEINTVIDGIVRVGTEDTNLYYSIAEAINVLKTDSKVHKKRCLLIFSDGEDDQRKGITQKEAEDAVKDSHIPIFTVTLPGSNLKDAEESAKILGSFARNSAGGVHFAPQLGDGTAYVEICEKINRRIDAGLVVRAGLENVKAVGDDTVYIKVELSDGTKKASDGITVPAGTILKAIEEAQGKKVEVTVTHQNANEDTEGEIEEEEPQEEEPQEEEPEGIPKAVLTIIVLFAVILSAVVFLLLGRKRKAEDEEEYEEVYEDQDRAYMNDTGASPISETTIAPSMHMTGNEPEKPIKRMVKHKSKIKVTLFRVGPGEEEKYELTVKNEVLIGRSKSCQLFFENDSALSGRHCSIVYREGDVFVRDENSTNGTFVNGVPIVGEFKVLQDDIILIGSSEYRIIWE